jgi:DNA/RNA-binding domain of Phe-tRNA-synthetase-like protein
LAPYRHSGVPASLHGTGYPRNPANKSSKIWNPQYCRNMEPVRNQLDDRIRIGFVRASNIRIEQDFRFPDDRLDQLLERRKQPLTEEEDTFRKACRDMMRIGSYKPTGRGKPASEYLLRSAAEGTFPRINTAADINNFISLSWLVPISLWDTDRMPADSWLFRPGLPDEEFVFNPSGQTISLHDLVTGFAVLDNVETPLVTPVKDCQITKTDTATRNIAGAVYYPVGWTSQPALEYILAEFTELLDAVSDRTESGIF